MGENISNGNSLRKKNMRVFWIGAMIATIDAVLTGCLGLSHGWEVTPGYPVFGDGWEWLGAIITIIIRVVPVVVVQFILYTIFYIPSRRDKEIPGLDFTVAGADGLAQQLVEFFCLTL